MIEHDLIEVVAEVALGGTVTAIAFVYSSIFKLKTRNALIEEKVNWIKSAHDDLIVIKHQSKQILEEMAVLKRNQQTMFSKLDDLRGRVMTMNQRLMILRSKAEKEAGWVFDSEWSSKKDS